MGEVYSRDSVSLNQLSEPSAIEKDPHGTLIFALVAERLSTYYEHHTWLTIAQGAKLAADWLARSKQRLSLQQRNSLSVDRFFSEVWRK